MVRAAGRQRCVLRAGAVDGGGARPSAQPCAHGLRRGRWCSAACAGPRFGRTALDRPTPPEPPGASDLRTVLSDWGIGDADAGYYPGNRLAGMTKQHIAQIGSANYPATVNCELLATKRTVRRWVTTSTRSPGAASARWSPPTAICASWARMICAAFQACTSLYRIHHPEASLNEARRLVAEWIDHHVVRSDGGPTPGCACR